MAVGYRDAYQRASRSRAAPPSAMKASIQAAKLSGIPVERILVSVYVVCSMCAGLAAFLIVGWFGSVTNADIEGMLRLGIPVCLGNDGFSNNMWAEWKTAYLLHKEAHRDPRRAGNAARRAWARGSRRAVRRLGSSDRRRRHHRLGRIIP